MRKTENTTNQTIRSLQDSELDMVTGGVIAGCIRLPVVEQFVKPTDWTFKDVFARYTIGR